MPSVCACGVCGLRVYTNGVYRKGHQPAGTSRDPQGMAKANHDIWNPTTNGMVKERARVAAVARIAKMPKGESMLTEADAKAEAERIMTASTSVGRSLEEQLGLEHSRTLKGVVMDYRDDQRDHEDDSPLVHPESGEPLLPPGLRGVHAPYFGYTARAIEDEALRWLTVRGGRLQAGCRRQLRRPDSTQPPSAPLVRQHNDHDEAGSDGRRLHFCRALLVHTQGQCALRRECAPGTLPAPPAWPAPLAPSRHGRKVRQGDRWQAAQGLPRQLAARRTDAR